MAQEDPVSIMPDPRQVIVKYVLKLQLSEAVALLKLCSDGALPREFQVGARKAIGTSVWNVMKEHGLVHTEGTGAGTHAVPLPAAFDEVCFMVEALRRPRGNRWKELSPERQWTRETGEWVPQLEKSVDTVRGRVSDAGSMRPATRSRRVRGSVAAPKESVSLPVVSNAPHETAHDLDRVEEVIRGKLDVARQYVSGLDERWRRLSVEIDEHKALICTLEEDLAVLRRVKELLVKK